MTWIHSSDSKAQISRTKLQWQPDGVLLVDKPYGCSSFDVIRRLKYRFGFKKIGHAGTLDPLATGLIIIVLGKATKLSQNLMCGVKEYTGVVELGVKTSTYDKEGEVIEKDIYVHSVDIKPYLDKVKDISGHDFEFIVSGVDSIPVVDCKTVKARYRIMKDKIGNAVASLGKFMKSHKFYRSMSKEDYGYEYDLNEKGKELGKIYVNGKHDSDEIEMWVESPQSAIGKKLPSVGLNGFASDGSIKFKDAKKAQDWLKRNADKIEQVLRGNADI